MTQRFMINSQRTLLAVALVILLSACGFKLRGQASLPEWMNSTTISGASSRSELVKSLELVLDGNGIQVTDRAASGQTATLKINQDRLVRDVLAVGANSEIREFVLTYDVSFSLLDPQGQEALKPQTLTMRREFTFDNDQLLSAASEEEFLRREMARFMARRIVDQITLLLTN